MRVMLLSVPPTTPDEKLEPHGAVIVDSTGHVLPCEFPGAGHAQGFLDACERSGVSLWRDMPRDELRKLYLLWHDAYKRT